MPLVKKIYTKVDNGSMSSWEEWDHKTIFDDSLFSIGQIYARVAKAGKCWRLFYRMGTDNIDLPNIFKIEYASKQSLVEGIDKFVDWAYDNQIRLIEAHERYCDKL